MISITFDGTDKRVQVAMRARGPQVEAAIRNTLDTLMLELQRRIQRKLSGEVLQNRTGKGLSSVTKEPITAVGGRILGRVTAGAGPAFYLRIQEKGGTHKYEIVPRTKKALAFFPSGSVGGRILNAGRGLVPGRRVIRGLYVKSGEQRGSLRTSKKALSTFEATGGVVVKKVVHPALPARPFMSTSLMEMREEIITRIRQAAARALVGKGRK